MDLFLISQKFREIFVTYRSNSISRKKNFKCDFSTNCTFFRILAHCEFLCLSGLNNIIFLATTISSLKNILFAEKKVRFYQLFLDFTRYKFFPLSSPLERPFGSFTPNWKKTCNLKMNKRIFFFDTD